MQRLTRLIVGLSILTSALASPTPPYSSSNLVQRQDNTTQAEDAEPEGPPIITIPSPVQHTGNVSSCAGYRLVSSTILPGDTGLDGTLQLIGNCSAYGPDYPTLKLSVRYETPERLRVRIADAEGKAHIVPDDVAPWPAADTQGVDNKTSALTFSWTADPFTFKVTRRSDGTVLFDTTGQAIIFEEQYVRVASALRNGSHIQGLGQHNDNFSLPIERDNYTRTLWTRDAYGVPTYTNLYGAHPIYVNQKVGQEPDAHGVFLLNSNGMDIRFPKGGKSIEYSILGGVLDFSFLNGPTPADVARQGTEVWGKPAEVPYWSLGFHSCKYGYVDIAEVAEVVSNYTAAGIPVQTQWMDIDYMYERWIQTLDPSRFALDKVRYVVSQLASSGRDFIVMVDPAVFSGTPNSSVEAYETYQTGVAQDVFMRLPPSAGESAGELYEGVVWPGPTVFPDWTAKNAQSWWTSEFERFFSPSTGVAVSGIWLDMNEPANFLPYLEANIYRVSLERPVPPPRPLPRIVPRSIAGFEAFQAGRNISESFGGGSNSSNSSTIQSRSFVESDRRVQSRQTISPGDVPRTENYPDTVDPELDNQWLYPPYRIQDRRQAPSTSDNSASGSGLKNISDFSARTDIIQSNGARTYSEHNLYGSRHAIVTRNALLARQPGLKPFTIARSSFSGTPSALWLGDNISSWEQYVQTIRQMLQFGAVQGIGMVGADSCGFGGNATETLCARWAWLGAFNTFYRNHNELGNIPQEFYRWPLTTSAARSAGQTRLRLLDYTYSFLHKQHIDGTPALWPLSWVHPTESGTIDIEAQFYFGPSILVSPVTVENSTSVEMYLGNTTYYDFFTLVKVQGEGKRRRVDNVGYDTMPLHIRGGSVVPLRASASVSAGAYSNSNTNTSAANVSNSTKSSGPMTTVENRNLPFHLIVAPNNTAQAEGYLRLDDGISLDVGDAYSDVYFVYNNGELRVKGRFGYDAMAHKEDQAGNQVDVVVFAGQDTERRVQVDGKDVAASYSAVNKTITVSGLRREFGEWSVKLV